MKTLKDIKPVQSDLSDRTITLSLTLHRDRSVSLRSCEVVGKGFRNRVSFNENRSIEDVLVAKLARTIKTYLRSLPDGAHVLSLPEFLVELPGLALSGAHLMIMEAKDGVRNAILRFKEFLGAVNNAFSADVGFHEPYPTHAEKLAVNVLADVCLPILNICRRIEGQGYGHDRRATYEISDRAREFEFQTELLKRFIFNAGMGYSEPTQAHLESETAPAFRQIST